MAGQPAERIVGEGIRHAVRARHRGGVAIGVVTIGAGKRTGDVALQATVAGRVVERGVLYPARAAADAVADQVVAEVAHGIARTLHADHARHAVVAGEEEEVHPALAAGLRQQEPIGGAVPFLQSRPARGRIDPRTLVAGQAAQCRLGQVVALTSFFVAPLHAVKPPFYFDSTRIINTFRLSHENSPQNGRNRVV